MKVKTPRCIKCNKIEFKNRVNLGYESGDVVKYSNHNIVCKECEPQLKILAKDDYGNLVYQN